MVVVFRKVTGVAANTTANRRIRARGRLTADGRKIHFYWIVIWKLGPVPGARFPPAQTLTSSGLRVAELPGTEVGPAVWGKTSICELGAGHEPEVIAVEGEAEIVRTSLTGPVLSMQKK